MVIYSKYPLQIDTTTELPVTIDLKTYVRAEVVNRIRAAVINIETELGTEPSSTFGTVGDRIYAIEAQLTQSGLAGGGVVSGPALSTDNAIQHILEHIK